MKLYDLCILIEDTVIENTAYSKGTFAIIIENYLEPFSSVEFWNFEEFDGADINSIDKKYLRLATEEEHKQFQDKFKQFKAPE